MAQKIFKDGKLVIIKSGKTINDIKSDKQANKKDVAKDNSDSSLTNKSNQNIGQTNLSNELGNNVKSETLAVNERQAKVPDNIALKIEQLKKDGNQEAIISLIEFFSHPVWHVRKLASDAVIEIGEKSIPFLSQTVFLTQTVDENTLYWCIRTLSAFGVNATSALITLLNSNTTPNQYKIFIIRALEKCCVKQSISTLINYLSDESWVLRREAATALTNMGDIVVPYLKSAFATGNDDTRYWAVKILGGILGKGAIDYFKKMLKSEKREMRYFAAAALGEIDDDDALLALSEAFYDESWLVRAQISEILEKKGKRSVPVLKKVLETGSSDAKYLSIKILSKTLGKDAISYISKIAQKADTELKFFTLSALAETNDESVISLLINAFNDNVWLVRKHASSLLEKFGISAVNELVKVLETSQNENMRYWALVTLANIGKAAHETLKKLLHTLNKKEKITLIQSFNQTTVLDLMSELFECFGDKDWPVRNEAFKKLSEYSIHLVPTILEFYKSTNLDIKYWSNQLIKTQAINIAESLILYLKSISNNNELKLEVIDFILLFENHESIDKIITFLKSTNDILLLRELNTSKSFELFLKLYLDQEKFKNLNSITQEFIINNLKSYCDDNAEVIIKFITNDIKNKDIIKTIVQNSNNPSLKSLFE